MQVEFPSGKSNSPREAHTILEEEHIGEEEGHMWVRLKW